MGQPQYLSYHWAFFTESALIAHIGSFDMGCIEAPGAS
jgi:hypothetical protein